MLRQGPALNERAGQLVHRAVAPRTVIATVVWVGGCATAGWALFLFHVFALLVLGAAFGAVQLIAMVVFRGPSFRGLRWLGLSALGGFVGAVFVFIPLYNGMGEVGMGRGDSFTMALLATGSVAVWSGAVGWAQSLALPAVVWTRAIWIVATVVAGAIAMAVLLLLASTQPDPWASHAPASWAGAVGGAVYGAVTWFLRVWLFSEGMDHGTPVVRRRL